MYKARKDLIFVLWSQGPEQIILTAQNTLLL